MTMVLDGGLATELEAAGHDVSSSLWSARLLADDPAAIVAAHAAFFEAGAQVAISASYQASLEGFAAAGIDAALAAELIGRSVRLARQAADDAPDPLHLAGAAKRQVAGSIGPYGAMLAGGEEYTGAYADPHWPGRAAGGLSVAELADFHRPRMQLLAEAGADLLACETIPCLAEVEALLAEVAAIGLPAWLSLTTVTTPDGEVLTRRGEPAAEAFAMAGQLPAVIAVGINCTDPAGAGAAVQLARAVCGKPVVVYPNSGESWDAGARRWYGQAGFAAGQALDWVSRGAALVGGCCRVGPAQIAAIAAELA
jgi:homocysteine S-methyltransferase